MFGIRDLCLCPPNDEHSFHGFASADADADSKLSGLGGHTHDRRIQQVFRFDQRIFRSSFGDGDSLTKLLRRFQIVDSTADDSVLCQD